MAAVTAQNIKDAIQGLVTRGTAFNVNLRGKMGEITGATDRIKDSLSNLDPSIRELNALASQFTDRIQYLINQRDDLQRKIDVSQNTIEDLKRQNTDLQGNVQRLTEANQQLENEKQEAIRQREEALRQQQELQRQLDQINEDIRQNQQNLQDINNGLGQIEGILNEQEVMLAGIQPIDDSINTQITNLQGQINATKTTIQDLLVQLGGPPAIGGPQPPAQEQALDPEKLAENLGNILIAAATRSNEAKIDSILNPLKQANTNLYNQINIFITRILGVQNPDISDQRNIINFLSRLKKTNDKLFRQMVAANISSGGKRKVRKLKTRKTRKSKNTRKTKKIRRYKKHRGGYVYSASSSNSDLDKNSSEISSSLSISKKSKKNKKYNMKRTKTRSKR